VTPALVAMLLRPAPAAAGDDWFGRDKALHFGATFVLAGGGYAAGAALWPRPEHAPAIPFAVGAAVAMGAGVAKEVYDHYAGGDPSLRDLTWDAIGTATGLVTAWLFDHYVFGRR
jgi:putative lipoprotein